MLISFIDSMNIRCGIAADQICLQMVTTMFHIATIVYRNAMAEVSATVLRWERYSGQGH